ncbi:hypothetical protein EC957_009299 [Mortierella hygrophila]|uniref:Uncharacterized protein n=1 Tax=Mortierella hygrophila TaxID=979708 RepID=A0A9P6K587_9FUNG|nr:hypothetical protein EC957_009299 [Mortierella hygrophila]
MASGSVYILRLHYLKSLEVTRITFSTSDWSRILANKPSLRKIVIENHCIFEDKEWKSDKGYETDEPEDEAVAMDMDLVSTTSVMSVSNITTNAIPNSTLTTNKINPSHGRGVMTGKRKHRVEDPKDIGGLFTKHLVLFNNKLRQPFQKQILGTFPKLD